MSLKEFGVVGLDTYTRGIKDFHKCWTGSLAKRRLCLGPAGVINCTSLSALSFWVSLFPGKRGYNTLASRLLVSTSLRNHPFFILHHSWSLLILKIENIFLLPGSYSVFLPSTVEPLRRGLCISDSPIGSSFPNPISTWDWIFFLWWWWFSC